MPSKATTVEEFLAELPEERRAAIEAVRKVVLENLNPGFEEGIQYGQIGYFIPHSIYPKGYHCDTKQPLPFLGIANQKGHMSFNAFFLYSNDEDMAIFKKEWEESGIKLDMGAACVRFKKLENVALDVIGRAVKRFSTDKMIESYESKFRSKDKK